MDGGRWWEGQARNQHVASDLQNIDQPIVGSGDRLETLDATKLALVRNSGFL